MTHSRNRLDPAPAHSTEMKKHRGGAPAPCPIPTQYECPGRLYSCRVIERPCEQSACGWSQSRLRLPMRSPHPIDVHVGLRIRQHRRLRAMNQKKLGAAVGVSFQMVQKYESGCYSVPASSLFAFAKVLNVPLSFFFEGPRLRSKDLMVMHETIVLVRAYLRIRDPTVRESIAEAIRAVARTSLTHRRGS